MKEHDEIGAELSWLFAMRHYYGDVVRALFLVAAVIIFLGIPLAHALPTPLLTVIIAATLLTTFFAGLTNPRQSWVALCDALIAAVGCLFFELIAIQAYSAAGTILNPAFYVLQVLAVDFLLAFYFSVKTVRGLSVLDTTEPEEPHHPHTHTHPQDTSSFT